MRGKLSKYRLVVLLGAIGPGVITASADNDAGGITTYSLAGARFGYGLLWVLILVTISLAVTQEMGARMGAITGKGFGGLIREKFGARWAALAILVMLFANLGTNTAEFAGIATSLGIFGLSRFISVPVAALAVFLLITRFNYRRVQKVFLASSLVYFTYVISGILAHPDWSRAGRNIVLPEISLTSGYLLMLVAVVGTTITPWGQFFIQSYTADKRLGEEDLPYVRADVYIGSFFVSFIAFFIIIACAASIWARNLQIVDAAHAAMALRPLAGRFASELFAFGLLNASLLGAAILPLTSAYATCETFGWEAGLDKTYREAPIFYGLFAFFIAASSIIVLIPHLPLLQIMFAPQVLNGVLLPVIFVFMLKIINDRAVMGRHTNSRGFNAVAAITAIVMVVLTVLLLASLFIEKS
jgi:NRAMP (natural resistance-associated macrophage protein)-like metal ion transporter